MLAEPLKIGDKTAPNRIVNQPMECNDADEVGNPTELTFDRYRRLAQGRAGIIFVEALTITQESRARKNQLGIYEQTAQTLERLVREMREINRESLILFQITHSGRQSGTGFSRLVSVYPTVGQEAHILSENEIEKIEDDFAKAALIAKQVGRGRDRLQTVPRISMYRNAPPGEHPPGPLWRLFRKSNPLFY